MQMSGSFERVIRICFTSFMFHLDFHKQKKGKGYLLSIHGSEIPFHICQEDGRFDHFVERRSGRLEDGADVGDAKGGVGCDC